MPENMAEETVERSGDALLVRSARPADRGALASIASRTWDGRDHLASVIEEWLDDPTGDFIVAEIDGTVVGTIKVSRLGRSKWWLEAGRVDPDVRGLGVGSTLFRRGVARGSELQAAEGGVGRMGALVDEGNVASLRIVTSLGFGEVVRFTRCTATCEPGARPLDVEPLSVADVARVGDLVRRWEIEAIAAGNVAHRPVAVALDDEQIRLLAESGRLYGWFGVHHDPERLDGLLALGDLTISTSGKRTLSITYLEAPGALAALAASARSLASSLGATAVVHQLQASPARVGSMLRARWSRPGGLNLSVLFTREVGEGHVS